MRASLGNNEYRSVLFSIDNDNIINATQVLLLNSFLKKSTKDYKKNITIAEQIITKYTSDVTIQRFFIFNKDSTKFNQNFIE